MSSQSEKEFNEENQNVLRTLDLAYFSEILKENEELKNTIKEYQKIERNFNKLLQKLGMTKTCKWCDNKATKIIEYADLESFFESCCNECIEKYKTDLGYANTYTLQEGQDFITLE